MLLSKDAEGSKEARSWKKQRWSSHLFSNRHSWLTDIFWNPQDNMCQFLKSPAVTCKKGIEYYSVVKRVKSQVFPVFRQGVWRIQTSHYMQALKPKNDIRAKILPIRDLGHFACLTICLLSFLCLKHILKSYPAFLTASGRGKAMGLFKMER